ncbi:MAG: helix-turn-helix domain-containing protein, partial [Lachnospiraceae bacterium]|nr:helix-turn-helix domain-containing protein [Lachnospiraceae bacterium]
RTIVQYIHSTRVLNAQRHFMETDDNVSEVMSLTGFTNLTHFNRVFRDVTGMSPSAFRKKCREEHSAHV